MDRVPALLPLALAGCLIGESDPPEPADSPSAELPVDVRNERYAGIRDAAGAKYSDGYQRAIDEPGELAFWADAGTRCGSSPTVVGEIERKYRALGGCGSLLGAPVSAEQRTPDGAGRYTVFERGSIYWTEATGAFEVHGLIRDAWAALGWEAGALGYPVSNEYAIAGGRRSDFQHGSITWSQATNTTTVTEGLTR